MRTHSITTLLALLILIGCNDNPLVTHEPVGCNIYVTGSWYGRADTDSSTMYVYDSDSLTLIDSLTFPDVADDAVASPDGRHLYIQFWPYHQPAVSRYIAKYNLLSRHVVWTRESSQATQPRLYDNGNLLVCYPEIINPRSGQVIGRLDESPYAGWRLANGPASGTEVCAIASATTPDRDSAIVVMDIRTGTRRGWFVPRLAVNGPPLRISHARLHPDGRRALCSGAASSVQDAWFVVGDCETGAQIFAARLSTPSYEIAISHDGTIAVVIDEGNPAFGYGWPAVYIFDLNSYQLLARLDGTDGLVYWPGRAQFLPGDRRVALMPDNHMIVTGWLQTLDLTSLTPEFVVDTPWFEPFLSAFTVGPRTNQ